MMTESPAHRALGKKQRHCIHVQNNEDCGCATGNLLATISRARRTIPPVVTRRRTALLGGASSHVGAESGASSSNLQWNEPVTFERCGEHVNMLSAGVLPDHVTGKSVSGYRSVTL